MISEIHLSSYAKVNLSLRILGIREDRFHEIESIMQSISLHDEITLTARDSGVEVYCDDPRVPQDQNNIAHSAASAFFSFTRVQKGISVNIKKSIPVAAGLAGGSTNAAAVLRGLDALFKTKLSSDQIRSIGTEVGSDVPFCLVGGRCRVRGRGEIVQELPILLRMWFVIVVPDIQVQTKWAYEEFDRWKLRVSAKGRSAYGGNGINEGPMHNDFEDAIAEKFPVIKDIKNTMIDLGAISASMSGSGPSVFGICDDEATAVRISGELRSKHSRTFVANNVNYGVKII